MKTNELLIKTITIMKTKKFFLLLAAVLLGSVSAMAQSGNNDPQKGDVNEDGTVDVADVVAVLKIMKDGGGTVGEQVVYYWYAGQEDPSSWTSINTTGNSSNSNKLLSGDDEWTSGGGWHELGTSVPGTIQKLIKGGVNGQCWYVMVPVTTGTTLKPTASDLTTPDTSVAAYGTEKTFNGVKYQTYIYRGITVGRNVFSLAKK